MIEVRFPPAVLASTAEQRFLTTRARVPTCTVIDKELLKPEPQVEKGQVNQGSARATNKQSTFRQLVTETLAEAMPSITAVYIIGIPIFGIGTGNCLQLSRPLSVPIVER
jgi:hypothetical protein